MKTRKNPNQGMTTKPRTSHQWRTEIDKITDQSTRIHTACVVFWDYITKMIDADVSEGTPREEASARHGHLDIYINRAFDKNFPSIANEEDLYLGLVTAGYNPTDAFNRSRDKGYQSKLLDPERPAYTRPTSRLQSR